MVEETSKNRLQLAAKEFESALNAYRGRVDVSFEKMEVTGIGDIRPKYYFSVFLTATELTKIYP